MQVPNIAAGLSNLTSPAKGDAKTTAAATAAAVNSAAPLSTSAAMRQVVAQYDMTDITPNEFSNMIQQLSDKGAISQKDLQSLSGIRIDLDSAGIGADDSVNLQQFYQQQLTKAQQTAAQSADPIAAQANVQPVAAKMTWIERFAAVKQQGSASGVNAVA